MSSAAIPFHSYLQVEKNVFSIPVSSVADSLHSWRKGKSKPGGERGSHREQSERGYWSIERELILLWATRILDPICVFLCVFLPHSWLLSLQTMWCCSYPVPLQHSPIISRTVARFTPVVLQSRIHRIKVCGLSNAALTRTPVSLRGERPQIPLRAVDAELVNTHLGSLSLLCEIFSTWIKAALTHWRAYFSFLIS